MLVLTALSVLSLLNTFAAARIMYAYTYNIRINLGGGLEDKRMLIAHTVMELIIHHTAGRTLSAPLTTLLLSRSKTTNMSSLAPVLEAHHLLLV